MEAACVVCLLVVIASCAHTTALLLPTTQISDLIAAGKVKLEVALSVPLADVAKAHAQVETGHTRGKVVMTV